MALRRYDSSKKIVPLQFNGAAAAKQIPLNAKLHSIASASNQLNEQFDGGFSETRIRRLIQQEKWVEGWHYIKRGGQYRIYLIAVQEWQLGH